MSIFTIGVLHPYGSARPRGRANTYGCKGFVVIKMVHFHITLCHNWYKNLKYSSKQPGFPQSLTLPKGRDKDRNLSLNEV